MRPLSRGDIRQIVDAFARPCPACGRRIEVQERADPSTPDHLFYASCHSSRDRYTLSGHAIALQNLDGLAAWFRGLFKLDAFPDMIELLAYNQGKLPGQLLRA